MNRTTNFNTWIECTLGKEYFLEWEGLSPDIRKWWEEQTETPKCEGTGVMTLANCTNCPFCGGIQTDEMD